MDKDPSLKRVFVLGAGRLGRGLLRELLDSPIPVVGAWTPSEETAALATDELGYPVCHGPVPALSGADVLFLAVPDRALVPLTEMLIAEGRLDQRHVLLHCSGALPSAALRLHPTIPAAVGCYHPLQTFSLSADHSREYFVALEGEEAAFLAGRILADALLHPTLEVAEHAKALYHAGAVMASNYLVTLVGYAADLLARSGISYAAALGALGSLAKGAINNLLTDGPARALTGPIARGDTETVENHLEAMGQSAPELTRLYRTLGRYTLALVIASGQTPQDNERLRETLKDR